MTHRPTTEQRYFTIRIGARQLLICSLLLSAGLLWSFSSGRETADQVPCPSGVVNLPDMNLLYRGYDNKIEAIAMGYPETVVSGNGIALSHVKAEPFPYYTGRIPGKPNQVNISVSGHNPSTGKSVVLGNFRFRVSDLPEGVCVLGNAKSGDILKGDEKTISVKPVSGLPIEPTYNVTSWELHCTQGKFSGEGDALSEAALAAIRTSMKGSVVSLLVSYKGNDQVPHTASVVVYR
jgi:hypothetical protein